MIEKIWHFMQIQWLPICIYYNIFAFFFSTNRKPSSLVLQHSVSQWQVSAVTTGAGLAKLEVLGSSPACWVQVLLRSCKSQPFHKETNTAHAYLETEYAQILLVVYDVIETSFLPQTDWDTSSEDEAELQKRKRELLRKLWASAQQDGDY